MTGWKLLFKFDNIQLPFALIPKKQEALASLTPKDKILQESVLQSGRLLRTQELFL